MTDGLSLPAPAAAPPRRRPRWYSGLFGSPGNALITAACLALLACVVPPLIRWAIIDATWTGSADACRANGGACWAFIGEKLRFILFGLYPPDQYWRPAAVLGLLGGLAVVSCLPPFWRRGLVLVWVATLAAVVLLLRGTGGPDTVPTDKWGGLPLTLLLAAASFACAFPLALLLALGRRSRLGIVRTLAIGFIETLRGVPLIAVLYVAILLFPLMLPAGSAVDKLLRAGIAVTLFVAAYLAEIIRAGLQAVPDGQYEAAKSIGLGYWQAMRLVVLPQALRSVIPAFVNLAIGILQDTTLVIVVGAFDLLNAARIAATDTAWLGFYDEAFGFAALIFFILCFAASRYSLWLERRLKR